MQQGGGGSQYGAPPTEMPPFSISGAEHAEAASPISSRPPNFDELAPAVPGPAFQDEDSLAAVGDEADRGGVPGNRWPRQETLALLKIRSDMDSAFRDATLKGPLWEEVSRKLAELGYIRSAKKCKEKFENVHKYYKRTKEGRAGRQDGKSYRFFSQLEALHSSGAAVSAASPNPNPTPPTLTSTRIQTTTPIPAPPITSAAPASGVAGIAGISFSSNTWSSESDDEDTEEMVTGEGRKRKYSSVGEGGSSGSGTSRKMMAFFEGLMKQVMERQEAMQQKFLETIEKREQDRMIREEAWKRQEMARLNREHELLAQDRAMAASRDAAVFSFLQKITGQTITIPTTTAATATATTTTQQQQSTPPPPPPVPTPTPTPTLTPTPTAASPKAMKMPQQQNNMEIVRHQGPSSVELGIVPVQEISPSHEAVASSRWPKTEVHALIRLRSGLETRYQEAGPKGPLWEEISSEMMKLGYNRSSKRCKEKWENINKYFKKVKESNKKRPEDAKTCPYFHQLDALYRKKLQLSGAAAAGGSSSSGIISGQALQSETNPNPPQQETTMPPPAQQTPPPEMENKSAGGGGGGPTMVEQIPTSNGGVSPTFFQEASSGSMMKKPEDIMMELMEQQQHPATTTTTTAAAAAMEDYDKVDEHDSDNMEEDDEEDDDEEDGKMQYEIQFQRPNVSTGNAGGSSSNATTNTASATTAATGSFMAMVQ
ncbi:hypothetical protein J5N97_016521 [Dioscorea zingiberensis]|uniref:Myb-like domain-containing protein n=1 Tax=Dioscorea zingiberensis TaxID=325984 RepID=A0A9D5CJJ1_9LILI|nr:hypothetical protein J5N97_016521 [Dioscorea zingiberensis]